MNDERQRGTCGRSAAQRGIALIAVLMALTLLMLLAVPFAVGMSIGLDAATTTADVRTAELGSASVRDLLLGEVALGHPALDPTPLHDSADEYPATLGVPEQMQALREDGRVLLAGEVWDLQRKIELNGVSPLLLANLLGTTARLGQTLAPLASSIQLRDGGNLPDDGYVWIDHELIHYGKRQGNVLSDLKRSQLVTEQGFAKETDHTVKEDALVLDYRCVVAATWPFDGRTLGQRRERKPYTAVGELAEIGRFGFGGFSAHELEVLANALVVGSGHETAPTWGRPERVFNTLPTGERLLRVKSSLHVGPGSTVRVRDVQNGNTEYGLVMTAATVQVPTDLLLPSEFHLRLLLPVTQDFPATDTVVEPLVPSPLNVNTADATTLAAAFAGIRRAQDVRDHGADGRQQQVPQPAISTTEARELAEQIVTLRGSGQDSAPFTGWQDLCERLWKPRFDDAKDLPQKQRWILLYRNLQTGRDAVLEMGTVPLCFCSGPWVGYRAAASVQRTAFAPGVAARHERTGVAVALPGLPLESEWPNQAALEETFRLDQRAPYWLTLPVNTGAVATDELGNNPAGRYFPHLVGMAYPDIGLGQPRFPSQDHADSGFRPATAVVLPNQWLRELFDVDTFWNAMDPRGRDIGREGAYLAHNLGPRDRTPGQPQKRSHDRIYFPFSIDGGFAGRFSVSFWAEPEDLANQTLLDYSDGNPERNRLALLLRDGNLVLEAIDEAGLDPDPSRSPAGLKRTAAQWTLAVPELGLPPRTAVHLNLSAYGTRPDELSLFVDGVHRGKPKYLTHLTGPIPVYDPQNRAPVAPGADTARYLDVPVESTEGFPPQGVVRIGLELFEYSSIQGNVLRGAFRDSVGGRSARQSLSEFVPKIPTDKQGKPTVDIDQYLQQNGTQGLAVAPEHPVGSAVELYGYSTLLSQDRVMQVGETKLSEAVGEFTVARVWLRNPVPITVHGPIPPGITIDVGQGLDERTTSDLELADPLTNRNYPPPPASPAIAEGFSASGGYALLVQYHTPIEFQQGPGQATGLTTPVGGLEVIKYGARQGTKLTGIQRAVQMPGDNSHIDKAYFDGTARKFVSNWGANILWGQAANGRGTQAYDVPNGMLFVVPISLPVANTSLLSDPPTTGTTEWLQLYSADNETNTEWVRYDLIKDTRFVVRSNRQGWDGLRVALTNQFKVDKTTLNPLGGGIVANVYTWPGVSATSGYIGYTPQLEFDWPMIFYARQRLGFRGDSFTGTSSHPQPNATVLPCHHMQMWPGNHGALQGRMGRQDRVTLVAGSQASGMRRPEIEWHTVNWVARRNGGDSYPQKGTPGELFGPQPFQLVAFKEQVAKPFLGPPPSESVFDPRLYDRIVKFPSGELPAAFATDLVVGGGYGNKEPMRGIIDEVHVHQHFTDDLVLDEECTADARQLTVRLDMSMRPHGPLVLGDLTAVFPAGGGLLQIDDEIVAYQSRANGVFTLAQNGRGLLHSEVHGHDRGARVRFLTHVPAAILSGGVQERSDSLPVQALGAMPPRGGAFLLGNEIGHYCWVRKNGDAAMLEMPRYYVAESGSEGTAGRGLFRGRFGTTPMGAAQGSAVIWWPIRYWDRYVPRTDDPEQACFQISCQQASVFWKSITWQQETTDANVLLECLCRIDGKPAFTDDPEKTPGLWRFNRMAGGDQPSLLGMQGGLLEARFMARYLPGCLDLATYRAHGWKTAPKVRDVRVEYEGQQGLILEERVTAR